MKTTIKLLSAVVITVFLSACGSPQFSIIPTGDKFTDKNSPYGFIGKNNRISTKSTKGGTHIDSKGVYLEPYVFKNKNTDKIESVGFFVTHYNYGPSDGFRPIQNITFLTDKGVRIVLEVKSKDSNFSVGTWNSVSGEHNTTYNESGIITTSVNNFKILASSKWIEAKIKGRTISQTYNKNEISNSFIKNINMFYNTKIAK